MRPLLALLVLVAVPACTRTEAPRPTERPTERPAAAPADSPSSAIPYDFDRPEAAFRLPRALREISGLTVLPDGRLGAVEDEHGVLYVLDAETAEVVARHRFHGPGDFEGLAAVGQAVWVLRSDGDLFEVTEAHPADAQPAEAHPSGAAPAEARADEPRTTHHRTGLHRTCDAEGLDYEPTADRLLIACKEDPGAELPGIRAIYAFNLSSADRPPAPVYRLDRAVLDAPSRPFKPSALAVHPRTGQLYVLSAVRRALAVLNPDGTLTAALALPATRYPQPEGLAFGPDGTLYVSTEGRGTPAVLFRFREQLPP